MHTVWFPAPVVVLLRRLVNVVSTFSISHHYLVHRSQALDSPERDTPQTSVFQQWRWRANLAIAGEVEGEVDGRVEDPPPPRDRHPQSPKRDPPPIPDDEIHRLINSTTLYEPLRKPRYPIVLCHGLYGFDVRGPTTIPVLQQHYWTNVLRVLRDRIGAEVLVTSVPSTGSVTSRAESLDRFLREKALGRGINFLAHSMGGLDCRHLITHIKPTDYTPLSLTTVATPHRGSPFMDWCRDYIGLGNIREHPPADKEPDGPPADEQAATRAIPSVKSVLSLASLPSSFTTLLLSLLDSPAYANLTSSYLDTVFNPRTPNDPAVRYFSVAGRLRAMSVWHPLWLPKMVLDGFEERERARLGVLADAEEEWGNDGLVTVQSARWGEFLGTLEGCDHWALRGARGLDVDLPALPGLSRDGADGWGIADWARFVRIWKSEEKAAAKSAGAGISERASGGGEGGEEARARGQERQQRQGDEVVRASTDKLSAVVDWIVDQVPATLAPGSREGGKEQERERSTKQAARNDLETKMDLERFYVALCRKLYDEGL